MVAGSVNKSTFKQNIPEFGDTKPKPDQGKAGANPRHEGSVSSLTGSLFAKFGGNIRLPWDVPQSIYYPYEIREGRAPKRTRPLMIYCTAQEQLGARPSPTPSLLEMVTVHA